MLINRSLLSFRILSLTFLFSTLISAPLMAEEIAAEAAALSEEAEDLSAETCMLCHEDDSARVDFDTFAGSVHADMDCIDCHYEIEEIPHPEALEKVDCSMCHDTVFEEFEQSVHHKLAENNVADVATCTSCHGVHNIYATGDPRSSTSRLKSDLTCLKCHGDPAIARQHPDMPPTTFFEDYENSSHGRGIHKKGLIVSATCTDCHGAHLIHSKSNPESTVHKQNIPTTCTTCHLGILEQFENSAHGKLWTESDAKAPVCTTCHESHAIGSPGADAFKLEMPNQCGNCHVEQSHTYQDSFHGKATSLGYVMSATCADCHTAHTNLAADDPASSVHPSNLIQTCGKCHDNPSSNFVGFKPHFDPKDAAEGIAHTIYLFMEWLLILVFAFWGLHTFLWLQRALVAVLRGEIHPKKEAETQYVKRFSNTTIKLHIVIIVSFLGLVATGLPLKYHFTHWAQWLVAMHGGIEVTRFIHRLLAIVTFGYCVFHLLNLFYQILFKRQTRLLFGKESLVPRLKDFTDLFQNVRWFLYMGKQPAFGRWTYFEKFDYFAVFWGVPVIGFSGLLMWFPSFFTQFLPGEFLNIAMTIHSEEALLAAAFIFIVHFFHNHLRPENFPMDISIFTGKITLERFKEERPEEYELLEKENRLAGILVPPPTPQDRRRSVLFGTCAVLIGLGLVAGILSSFIFH